MSHQTTHAIPADCTPKWLLRFEDPEQGDALFDTATEAMGAWKKASLSWNCWLFAPVLTPGQEATAIPPRPNIDHEHNGEHYYKEADVDEHITTLENLIHRLVSSRVHNSPEDRDEIKVLRRALYESAPMSETVKGWPPEFQEEYRQLTVKIAVELAKKMIEEEGNAQGTN